MQVIRPAPMLGVTTLFIAPGSPWENGYIESLIGKLRDELLNGEIFYTLHEAQDSFLDLIFQIKDEVTAQQWEAGFGAPDTKK